MSLNMSKKKSKSEAEPEVEVEAVEAAPEPPPPARASGFKVAAGRNIAGTGGAPGPTLAVVVMGREASAIAAVIAPSDSSSFPVSHPAQNFERESLPCAPEA